jgi:hypothetical protein
MTFRVFIAVIIYFAVNQADRLSIHNVRVSRAGPLTFKINLPGLPGVGWIGCSVIFTISSHCSEIFQDLGRVPFLFSSDQSQVFHKILACLVQHR